MIPGEELVSGSSYYIIGNAGTVEEVHLATNSNFQLTKVIAPEEADTFTARLDPSSEGDQWTFCSNSKDTYIAPVAYGEEVAADAASKAENDLFCEVVDQENNYYTIGSADGSETLISIGNPAMQAEVYFTAKIEDGGENAKGQKWKFIRPSGGSR